MTAKFKLGERSVDTDACEISHNGSIIRLTPRAMAVLGHLAHRSGEVVALEELLRDHWPRSVTSPNAVHKIAAELRHAFGEDGSLIETIPKRGYRLLVPIAHIETSNGAGPTKQTIVANGESRHEEDPAVDRAWRPIARNSSIWIACGLLAFLGAASLALFLTKNIDGIVIKVGDRSAVLLTDAPSRATEQDRRDLDAIRDKVIARLRTAGTASIIPMSRFGLTSSASQGANAWDADYVVRVQLTEVGGRLSASLSFAPANSGDLAHHERFDEPASERLSLLDTLVHHTTEDLTVLLDTDRLAQMRNWGTSNVDAYRLAREGDTFQAIQAPESQNQAAEHFRQAIRQDPKFRYAYLSLGTIYETLFITPTDTAHREHLRQSVQELAREASAASIDAEAQGVLDRLYKEMSAGSAFDAEEQWRNEIIRNPKSFEGFNRYSRLLAGARLFAEGRQYLERSIQLAREAGENGWVTGSQQNYATHAEGLGNFDDAARLMKWNVAHYPDATASLFGLVRTLARAGRYAEAEAYLARLRRTNEAWGYGAAVWLATLRGDIKPGSAALEQTLADPRSNNSLRGLVCFLLGDVECGVKYWRQMEPAFVPIYWEFAPGNEVYFAPAVLTDPRYRALVDDLGWGSRWRAHIRKMAAELTPITGIEVTTSPPPEDIANQ